MSNQYVNKVVLNGVTRLDLSGDTVTADKLLQGYTAHDKTGALITGTMTAGGGEIALVKGTASLLDTNVLAGNVDFASLIADNREFFLFVENMDFTERTANEILFGHYTEEGMYLQYYEGNEIFNVTQVDISEITATSTTLGINIADAVYFASCNYTVLYAEQAAIPTTITAGDTPVILCDGVANATGTSYIDSGLSITITKAGTYRFKWVTSGGGGSSNKGYSRLYKNNTAVGVEISTATVQQATLDLACAPGDVLKLQVKGFQFFSNVGGAVGGLCACVDWDNGF